MCNALSQHTRYALITIIATTSGHNNQIQQFVLNICILIFHSDCNSVKCEVKNKCVLGKFVPMPISSVDCQVDFIWILDNQVKEKGKLKWNVEMYMKK